MKTDVIHSTKMRIWHLPLLFIVFSLFSCSKKHQEGLPPLYNKSYKQEIIDSRNDIKGYMFTNSTPGLSVAVSINGELVWSEGIGLASKELRAPATRETKFRIGSTSQIFTCFLIAKQQEEGLVDVDTSFYDYVPKFPKKKYDFTPRMLGADVSGFPQFKESDLLTSQKIKTLREFIKKYEQDTLLFQPGEFYYQTAYSYGLLGILAEQVGKAPFSKLVKEMLLDTLKLENTILDYPSAIIPNRSDFYDHDYIARLINAPAVNLIPFAPALGFLSTADDLNKVGQILLAPGFLTKKSIELFYTPNKLLNGTQLNQSFGWISTKDNFNRMFIASMGSTVGGSASILVFPKQKLVVSVCSNIGDKNSQLPSMAIAQNFLKILDPQKEPENEKKKQPRKSEEKK